jgi:4-hydroxy-tetrahydrodipicolinate synthase
MSLGSVLTAAVTPFDDQLNVNEEAFVALLAFLAENGSDGAVVCGTTGEASTLSDEEHLRVIELAVENRPSKNFTIIAGTGSNDTRHAVHLTERATELGVDATLSVTPYYNKPNQAGIRRHYEEISKATDKPIVLYNIPSRVVVDLPNEFLAELAQIDHVEYLKQANNDNLELIDGLGVYAGNDDLFARTLDIGGLGGILVASHVVGPQMQQMVTDPDRRSAIDKELTPVYDAMGVTTNPIPVKKSLQLLGHEVGALRLPMVEADAEQTAQIKAVLESSGLLTGAAS